MTLGRGVRKGFKRSKLKIETGLFQNGSFPLPTKELLKVGDTSLILLLGEQVRKSAALYLNGVLLQGDGRDETQRVDGKRSRVRAQ